MNSNFFQSQEHVLVCPRIRCYTNILTYFSDYFKYIKSKDSKVTYESWAYNLGFQSSTIMYLISKGKRPLTEKSALKLAKAFALNEQEEKHLLLLSHYQRTKSVEIKSVLFDKILESLEIEETRLEAQIYKKFIISSTMPLVHMILSYDDSTGSEKEIMNILDISKSQLTSDLSDLQEMGLVQKIQLESENTTVWKSVSKFLKFPDKISVDILNLFYSKSLAEASEALSQKQIYKKFRSLILAIDPCEYNYLEDEIEQFANKLKSRFASNNLKNKHLVKFHFQSYQVSKIK